MANTPNIDLVKPAGTDHALVSVINSNSDKIDSFAGTTNAAIANKADYLDLVRTADTQSTPLAVIQAKYGDITAGDYTGIIYTSGNRWQYHGYKYNANNGVFVCSSYGNSTIVIIRVSGGTWTSEEIALKSDTLKCTQVQLTVSATISAGSIATIFTGLTLGTSSLVDSISGKTLNQLFYGKTIYGVSCIYTTGVCLISDVGVESNSKLNLRLYNASSASVNATAVRLLIFSN